MATVATEGGLTFRTAHLLRAEEEPEGPESKPVTVNPVHEPHDVEGGDVATRRPWRQMATTGASGDNEIPRDWVEGVSKLTGMDAPAGFKPERWAPLVADAEVFLDRWAAQAQRLGWSSVDVFGVHRHAPAARLDAQGLVPALGGDRIVAMTNDDAVIENARGARLRHCRRLTAPANEIGLIWQQELRREGE